MKVLAITQARYGSTRLPAKILKEVNGMTLLEIHLRRILQAKAIDKLRIATTDEEGSKYIVAIADKLGVEYYKGSVNDVLDRFYNAAAPENPVYVVRFTSDCPLVDPKLIDEIVQFATEHNYDYVSTDPNSFPDGLDTEVVKFSALKRAYDEAVMSSDREHVMTYIWENGTAKGGDKFKSYYYKNPQGNYNANEYRITIDEPEDFAVIHQLITNLGIDKDWKTYIDFLLEHNEIRSLNSKFHYNEGLEKSHRENHILKK